MHTKYFYTERNNFLLIGLDRVRYDWVRSDRVRNDRFRNDGVRNDRVRNECKPMYAELPESTKAN